MKLFNQTLIAAAVIACSALTPAAAGPIVTQWDVDLSGIWSARTPASVTISGDQQTLSWGVPSNPGGNQSSLAINNPPANDTVDTFIGGGAIPSTFNASSISLTHNNNVIQSGSSLASATLELDLNLTPLLPSPGSLTPITPVSYKIQFSETPNTAGSCAVTSPTPCNDIFVLLTGLLNTSFFYDSQEYFINAFPISGGKLNVLNDAACASAGAASGCTGFTTPENQSTRLDFGFTVSTLPLSVPEPGSMALLGLALGALALSNRKRSAKSGASALSA